MPPPTDRAAPADPPIATWRLLTPPPTGRSAAIAALLIRGPIDRALAAAGIRDVPPDRPVLRDLAGVDSGLAARVGTDAALLFGHAGPAVLRSLMGTLERAGIQREAQPAPWTPETDEPIERRMLDALRHAASPLAVDLLLDQPRRWAADPDPAEPALTERSTLLNRLIKPPLVVAIGPANVGKSTLVNALAGRSVAIVADVPGTTRDHVGVRLDLAGLTVDYVDTPGVGPVRPGTWKPGEADLQRRAQALASQVAAAADLILLCGDARSAFGPLPAGIGAPVVRVALRMDLGQVCDEHDAAVALPPDGPESGLSGLIRLIRDRLVPTSVLEDPRPWRFW